MNKIIKLSAEWCGPCRQYAPHFKIATKNLTDWEVITLDIDNDDEGREMLREFDIRGVPATLIFRGEGDPEVILGPKTSKELTQILGG